MRLPSSIILLNGPPQSGKNTIASTIGVFLAANNIGFTEIALAEKLRKISEILIGRTLDDAAYNKIKDQSLQFGETETTLRQLMINMSENFFKQHYGPNIWAQLAIAKIFAQSVNLDYNNSRKYIVVITDLGFQEEIDAFTNEYYPNRLLLVHVNRPGKSFTNDSRKFVQPNNPEVPVVTIENSGSYSHLFNEVKTKIIRRLIPNMPDISLYSEDGKPETSTD